MKKVIFLAIAAAAALTACSKSEVIDSKFGNDMIGFETYLGRDAQTKASVIDNTNIQNEEIGLYGFYTASKKWQEAGNPKANLWDNEKLYYGTVTEGEATTQGWTYDNTKYWTNDVDYYSFLAYAPKAAEGNGIVAALDNNESNPTVTYTVNSTLSSQKDLLYATPLIDKRKTDFTNGVALTMQHALSRISISAKENHPDYTYTITGLSLKGNFVETNTLDLKTGNWAEVTDATTKESDPYNFTVATADVTRNEFVKLTGDEYLMIIPTSVTEAILTVAYKTTYGTGDDALISNEIKKDVKISQEFAKGKAYSLNLEFGPNADDVIKFTVSVADWVTEGTNPETPVTPDPANPEEGDDTPNA